jgi:WD40 repeat protein
VAATLFISYARSDDEPFVKRLHEDLATLGFAVWWDRRTMESRGRTFLQEIRDAISSVERLLLVIGPHMAHSDYVEAEWRYALKTCRVIVPILRLGDRSLMPEELHGLHCPDFRDVPTRSYEDALAELSRILATPIPALASLFGVDALPPHFIATTQVRRVRAALLKELHRPDKASSAQSAVVLEGMGGSGKSVIAAAIARDCETRRSFEDGVIWLRFGRQAHIDKNLQLVGRSQGDDQPQHYLETQRGAARLSEILEQRNVLLVLDDIWDIAHLEPFRNALSARSRLLVTTRDASIAANVDAETVRMEALTESQSLMLLSGWSGHDPSEMPAEATLVAKECGYLPLALAMVGAMSRGKLDRWKNILNKLQHADLEAIQRSFPNYPYPNLLRAMQVSVDALEPEIARRYLDLAVFPDKARVPESVLQMLWAADGLDAYRAQDFIDAIVERSLARRDEEGFLTLHDLQADYVRAHVASQPALHRRLIDAYAKHTSGSWGRVADDGYFFQNFPYHLIQAGSRDELRKLLFDMDWIEAKLAATNAGALASDYRLVGDDASVQTLGAALALSAFALGKSPSHLSAQLCGRLLREDDPEIRAFLDRIERRNSSPWLKPLTASLTAPRGLLLAILGVHPGVSELAAADDGERVISASLDGTIKVWGLDQQKQVTTFTLHRNLSHIALASNGDLALTAAAERDDSGAHGTIIYVWDLHEGVSLQSWRYPYPLKNLLVTPDSRNAVCVLDVQREDGTRATRLSYRNLPDGEPARDLEGDVPIWHLAVSKDGQRAISANFYGLFAVWNVESSEIVRSAITEAGIWRLALSRDGRRALVAHFRRMPLSNVTEDAAYLYHRQARSTTDPFYDQMDLLLEQNRSPDESVEFENAITMFDLDSRKKFCIMRAHFDKIDALAFHPDNIRAVSASWDGTIKIWDTETGQQLETLLAHSGKATNVAIVPDGSRAVSCGTDNAIKVWRLSAAAKTRQAKTHGGAVSGVAIMRDGRRAISGAADGLLMVWDAITGEFVGSWKAHATAVTALVLASDGRHIISAGEDGSLCVWDLELQSQMALDGHAGAITALTLIIEDLVVSAGIDGAVKIWHWKSGAEIHSLQAGSMDAMMNRVDPATAVAGAVDSNWVMSVTYQFNPDFGKGFRKVLLWELGNDAPPVSLNSSFAYWRYSDVICFVPLRGLAAFGTIDGNIGIWDAANGSELPSLPGHPDGVVKIAASGDGHQLVSAGADGIVKIWNLDTGKAHCEMTVDAAVTSLYFSQDDRRVVACTESGAIFVWNRSQGEVIAGFHADAALTCSDCSLDGTRIVAGESTGRVHILQLPGLEV